MMNFSNSKKLLEKFVEYHVVNGHSMETVDSYTKTIQRFLRFCGEVDFYLITKQHLISWIFDMRKRGLDENYICTCLWAIRSFYKFLTEEIKLTLNNWFDGLKIKKRELPNYIEFLENKEVKKLIETISPLTNIHILRLRVLVEVLLNTGCRPSEALNLKIEDIRGDEAEIIGKGNRKRKIYFNQRVKYWIREYLKRRNDNCPYLFITHCHPRKLSLRTAEGQFKKFFEKTKIKKKVTLHTLRHTYATNLLSNGCPPDFIQRLLGHAKIDTTRIYYLSLNEKNIKKSHFKYLNYGSTP